MNIRSTLNQAKPIKKDTPYQRVVNSGVGKIVGDHKVGTAATAVAATAVIAGGALQSDTFAQVAQYGIVPAVGGAVAAFGGAAVHDALVNDRGDNNFKAAAKGTAGMAALLGGTQVVGATFDIPVLDEAFTGLVFDHIQGLSGVALVAGAAYGAEKSADFFKKAAKGEDTAASAAIGTGIAAATVGAGLGGAELIGRDLGISGLDRVLTNSATYLAQSPAAAVVGGTLLAGGAAVAGAKAVSTLSRENSSPYASAGLATFATAGALGGVEMAGHGLGLEATQGLFTEHAEVAAGVGVASFGGAVTKHAIDKIQEDGLTPVRSLMLAGGAGATAGGAALAVTGLGAESLGQFLGDSALTLAGAGLGVASYSFGEKAVENAKKGRFGTAAFQGASAVAAGASSLAAIGAGTQIPGLDKAAETIMDHTLTPLAEHVLSPTLEFFFDNPVIGGLGLAAAVGGFAYSQMRHNKSLKPEKTQA